MPLFDVEVYALMRVVRFAVVEIEAESAEEAKRLAMARYEEGDFNLDHEELQGYDEPMAEATAREVVQCGK